MVGKQLTIFYGIEADKLKKIGMDRAKMQKSYILEIARQEARRHCKKFGSVTIDDVQAAMIEAGYSPSNLGMAAGSVFKGSEFYATGRYIKSTRVSSHSRPITVWRLSEEG